MATDKLSEGIKRHIDGWELIAEKNGDFNLGDEVVKNLFCYGADCCNEIAVA